MELKVNETVFTLDVPGEERLLWVLRDWLGLTGTKFGCGIGSAARARCMSTVRRFGRA
ncbi:MAG: hypothetical protein OXF54_06005 [Caldilineaceae bacterium]|nr:hypothetical protein [Caldilineaceae bacterium]